MINVFYHDNSMLHFEIYFFYINNAHTSTLTSPCKIKAKHGTIIKAFPFHAQTGSKQLNNRVSEEGLNFSRRKVSDRDGWLDSHEKLQKFSSDFVKDHILKTSCKNCESTCSGGYSKLGLSIIALVSKNI